MTTRRLVAVLAFVLCVPLLSTTVAHAQPTEPAPPAPAQEAPQQPPIPADEAPVPPREVQLLPTPEESPAPESEAESVVLELQPTIEVTDPDERDRAWARAVQVYPGYEDYVARAQGRVIPVIRLTRA